MITAMKSHEEQLLRYQRRDDREALTRLVAGIHKPAYRRALHFLRDPAAAEDAVQEALISLVRGARRYRPGSSFDAWWAAILRNAIRDEARKLTAKARRDARAGAERWRSKQTESAALADDRLEALSKALDQLPFELREAVLLRYFENQSRRDIAKAQGVSERTTTTRLRRGLDQLRVRLSAAGCLATKIEIETLLGRLITPSAPSPALPSIAVLEKAALEAKVFTILSKAATVIVAVMATGGALRWGLTDERRPAPPVNREARAATPEQEKAPADPPEEKTAPKPAKKAAPAKAKGEAKKPAAAKPAPFVFKVRIVDERGKALAGVPVELRRRSRRRLRSEEFRDNIGKRLGREGRSDERGLVRMRVPVDADRDRFVIAAFQGELAGRADVPEGDDVAVLTLRSALTPPPDRGSLVVELGDRRPKNRSRAIRLALKRRPTATYGLTSSYYARRCDARGRLYLTNLEEGSYELSLGAGRGDRLKRKLAIRAGRVTRLTIEEEARGVIEGELRAPTGAAASVTLSPGQRGGTLRDGRYRFADLEPGRYVIEASIEGYPKRRVSIEVKPGLNRAPLIAFATGHSLAGKIRHPSASVERLRVKLSHAALAPRIEPCFTDEDGRFAFKGIPPGRYRLSTFSMDAGVLCSLTRDITVAGERDLGELSLESSPILEVAVRDAGGAPVAGATIELQLRERTIANPRAFEKVYAKTDARGRASVTTLWASPALIQAGAGGSFSKVTELELTAGGQARLDLRLDTPAARLVGILDGRGASAEFVAELVGIGPFWVFPPGPKRCSAEGRFVFDGLPPGRYHLKVGDLERFVDLVSGDQELRFDLDAMPAKLELRTPDGWGGVALRGVDEAGRRLELYRERKGSSTVMKLLPEGEFEIAVSASILGPDGALQTFIKRGSVQLRRDLDRAFVMEPIRTEDCVVVRGRAALPPGSILMLRGPVEVEKQVGAGDRFAVYLPPGSYRAFVGRRRIKLGATPTPEGALSFKAAGREMDIGAVPVGR